MSVPGAGGEVHEIEATQPVLVTDPSEVNTKVKHPVAALEVTTPGELELVKEPINGELELLPLYMYKKSKLFSRLKAEKFKLITSPAVLGHMVYVRF